MSGFDFDALRDPVAPDPGARERAGVEARARQLHARRRRNRIIMSATSLVAVVAIVVGVVAVTRNPGPSVTVTGPSTTLPPTTTPTTAGPSIGGRFIPPTSVQDGLVVLPVTLPDGETFTLRYPPAMKIAQLGFSGGINVGGRQASISYTTVQHVYGGVPIGVFPGANATQVSVFDARQRSGYIGTGGAELAFQFGPWLAVVEAPAKAADRATLAASLSGTTDANGYLVLHAQAPLSIGNGFDGGFGTGPGNYLELASHSFCGQPESDTAAHRRSVSGGQHAVSWCDGDLHVSASGSGSFVDLSDTQLHVGPLTPPALNAPTTSTTTTTTTPAAPPSPAVSASFVSPERGWVLEQNGTLDETTDAGATWHKVGRLQPRRDRPEKIRFIGPSDGFAFGPNTGAPALRITHDAGAHWIGLETPFSSVSDLAIARGVVYVVGVPATASANGPFPGFRIWSTPVGHLVWSMDPLVIPVGAGPVPEQQLVLAGDAGWMVNNDRDVISGARLSPTSGRWSKWTPPCEDVGGPAALAASTSQDLVAVCPPGFASQSETTYLEVSHDGGATFTRRAIPGAGGGVSGPFSPSPGVAVVANAGALERTGDRGASWHLVSHIDPNGGAPDFGFTTPTQGFVILGDGQMLMTYDAGVGWTQVTLP